MKLMEQEAGVGQHLANAPQVITHEVHNHEVLCTILLGGSQGLGSCLIGFWVIWLALGGALDGAGLQPPILSCLQKSLWGGAADLRRMQPG